MNKAITYAMAATCVLAAGCATKRYPIATEVSPAERDLLDCREIELELVRAEGVRRQISETATMDWRSVAGFLGDYGIGNAMAKNDAERAITNRVAALQQLKYSKGCTSYSSQSPLPVAPLDQVPTMAPTPQSPVSPNKACGAVRQSDGSVKLVPCR